MLCLSSCPSLLHMRLEHPSPGRATCVLGFGAAFLRREAALGPGSTALPFLCLCFPSRVQHLVSWNKEQEHRNQIPMQKRGTGCCGQTRTRQVCCPLLAGPAPSWLGLGLTTFHGMSPMDTQRVGQGHSSSLSFLVPRFQGFHYDSSVTCPSLWNI